MTVFDIGASHGYYTLLFAKLVREGSVHAFEPEEWNFQRLNTNLALNGFENVLPRRAAIFERSGEVELNVFPQELYGWHTLGAPAMEVDGRRVLPAERQTVPALTLDGYCEEHGIERIDLLKLDVEGAEIEALRGADRLLREGRISCIVFEVSQTMVEGMKHEPAEIFDLVRAAGLTVHELRADGTLQPAPAAPDEQFQNFVALAQDEAP
jgi:FkbM family methyltransferase